MSDILWVDPVGRSDFSGNTETDYPNVGVCLDGETT